MGMTPHRLTRPTVGFTAASIVWLDGPRIDPDVSVPTLAAQRFAAVPMPELEPPTKFASSDSPAFAMMIAPAAIRFFVSVASYGGTKPSNASAPPEVGRFV